MAKPFSKLREQMSPAARRRSAARTRKLSAAMPRHDPRQAVQMSQALLAQKLRSTQAKISKIEHRKATRK